jgi:hypothetical protein
MTEIHETAMDSDDEAFQMNVKSGGEAPYAIGPH